MAQKTVRSEERLVQLKWLEPAVDISAAERRNLAEILQGLQLLASDSDREDAAGGDQQKWDAATPPSLQAIKSGTTALTKHWTSRIANAGGSAGFLTLVSGAVIPFVRPLREAFGEGDAYVPIVVSLIGGASVILAAVAISLAIFVKGDLEARGAATAARHRGRADVAVEFLRATSRLPSAAPGGSAGGTLSTEDRLLLTTAAFGSQGQVIVDVPSKSWVQQPITGLKRLPDGRMELRVGTSDWVGLEEVTTFSTHT